MKWKKKLLTSLISLALFDADAGVMREDVDVQDYRDFAENKGKYTPGATGVIVYKTDGTIAGELAFPIPDFSVSDSLGIATLVKPSYITSVKHNSGYSGVDFGNNAKFKTTYKIINRNNHPTIPEYNMDIHIPRLNKVVTETAPIPTLDKKDIIPKYQPADQKAAVAARFQWFTRVGSGVQYQVDPVSKTAQKIGEGYKWLSAGMFTNPAYENDYRIQWQNYGPPDSRAQPFSSAAQAGDSGSPVFVFDGQEKIWKLLGVTTSVGGSAPYNFRTYMLYFTPDFMDTVLAANTDPDVTDSARDGTITWAANAITQGANRWDWHGVSTQALPSNATSAELDATKDLRFNGDGGTIVLEQAVNHGAAKLQFSADYTVTSAEGKNSTWVGGGIEVDDGKTVSWQVNGLAGDTLHKIGAGTLYVNAEGINGGALNVGDGKVVLAQRQNADGQSQAFSTITLVSGRPTVQLAGENQIAADNVQFGFRGGNFDLNGYNMTFDEIKHNDDGAILLNTNDQQRSTLALSSKQDRLFIGEIGAAKSRDNLDLVVSTEEGKTRTLAGDVAVNALTLTNGNLILRGRPTPHANNLVISNDWIDSAFVANTTTVNNNTALMVGEHGALSSDVNVSDSAELVMQSRSKFSGSAYLAENATLRVIQDSSLDQSTDGYNDVEITADIRGDGKLVKDGDGILWYTGNGGWTGGTTIAAGQLALNGTLSSSLTMGDETLLSGSGTTADITLGDNAVIYPGWQREAPATLLKANAFTPQSLSINGTLTTGNNSQAVLRTQLGENGSLSDRLTVNGDIIGSEPLWLNLSLSGEALNTDANSNGMADAQEGVSLVQVNGNVNKDSVKLSGGYVAMGAWRYSLYAFAPGKSDADGNITSSARYWDYRLQNDLLSEGENTIPTEEPKIPDDELPDVTPVEPEQPDVTPPADTPAENEPPSDNVRRAVIPQVPSYLSLPTALLNYNNMLRNTLHQQAMWSEKQDLGFFMEYFHQDNRYNSDLSFSQFGYDFDQKANGFLFGGRVARWQSPDEAQQLSLNVAWSTAELSVTPHAQDGDSQGDYTAHTLSTLTEWRHASGWFGELMLDVSKYSGDISTTLRGENVANVKAKGLTADLNVGRDLTFGRHVVTPAMGVGVQYLDIDDISDVDSTHASYDSIVRPLYHAGLGYRYHLTDALELTAGSQVNWDESNNPDVTISGTNTDQTANFSAATPGSYASFTLGVNGKAAENITLFANGGYQARLGEAGVDGWQFNTGVNVSFR